MKKILMAAFLAAFMAGCATTETDPIIELESRGLERSEVSSVGWGNCRPVSNPDPYAPPVLCEGYAGTLFACPAKIVETVNGDEDLGKVTIKKMMEMYFDESIDAIEYFQTVQQFNHCVQLNVSMIVEIDPVTYRGQKRSSPDQGEAYVIRVEDWEGDYYWAGYIISVKGQGT